MTSGWDKSPGPGNDYTPLVTSRGWVITAAIIFAVVLGWIFLL